MSNFTPEQIEQFLEEFFNVVGRRQYVGARYVPLFGRKDESSIEWDNTKPYEPLTIVLYQGNSYTSRTYVPTGVEITDTYYWANTGNYNAQVEMYRRETLALQEECNRIDLSKCTCFDTVQDMQSDEHLKIGMICHTNGFYESGDGGAAWYEITDSGIANEMDVIACGNLFAHYIPTNIQTIASFGIKENEDCGDKLNYVLNLSFITNIIFNKNGNYITSKSVVVNSSNRIIDFNGATLTGNGNTNIVGALFDISSGVSVSDMPTDWSFIGDDNYPHNITVKNAIFIDGDTRGETNSFGCDTGTYNCTFENIKAMNSHRKATAPQSYVANIKLKNIECINCRSGIEIGRSLNVTLDNIYIITDGSNNSTSSSEAPEIYGLAFEGNINTICNNIKISGFEENQYCVMTVGGNSENTVINNLVTDGGILQLANISTEINDSDIICSNLNCYTRNHVKLNNSKISCVKIQASQSVDSVIEFESCDIYISNNTNFAITITYMSIILSKCKIICSNRIDFLRLDYQNQNAKPKTYIKNCSIANVNKFMNASIVTTNGLVNVVNNIVENNSIVYDTYGANASDIVSIGNVFQGVSYTANNPKLYYDLLGANVVKN